MVEKKSLCALVPVELHQRVTQGKAASGQTLNDYMTNLLTEYYEMKDKGGCNMASGGKTMAFLISVELFQRIKAHLKRESARTGEKLTQREFVIGLIEAALDEAERNATAQTPAE